MSVSFSVQDIFGSLLAFILFPLVFVFPGYVCAYIFNLFDFKKRLLPARLTIAVMISMAISPILFFLGYRFGSSVCAFALIILFLTGFVSLFWLERKTIPGSWGDAGSGQTVAIWIFVGWSLFAILSLVDIQLGKHLYYSVVSYDLTTRVSITNAITRTGVPPIIPGYFDGNYVHLTFLYYFWYILCSLIDQIGGKWVDARLAMIASVAWCGISLMCTIALYLRLRNPCNGSKAWKSAILGIGALTISGLDILPVSIVMIVSRLVRGRMAPEGDIEHWNEQITAWLSAITWVPHHVASLIACVAGFLLIQSVRGKSAKNQIAAAGIAGLAFASATGLSVYVTAVFVIFWVAWILFLFLDKKEYRSVFVMILPGIFALIAISPYLGDLLRGGSSSATGSFPVTFQVRVFRPFLLFLSSFPEAVKNLFNLSVLPLNYFMELGFYFVAGFLWLRKNGKNARTGNSFYIPEILLLGASVFVGTFVRSTTIASNDLGWRSWMFGQFVLLIWAVDIGQEFLFQNRLRTYFTSKLRTETLKYGKLLAQLMVIGMLTSIFSLSMLRVWPMFIDAGVTGIPTGLSPDTQLGKRTFAARQAYEYIRDTLPDDVIVQYNPTVRADRPSGLYGTRQMVAADYSAFGVPPKAFQSLQFEVGSIFQNGESDWSEIDQNCKQHYIDVIILNDLDPVWQNLPVLIQQRQPLHNSFYYAIFACGDFANR
jgi:hypothetical protein